MNEWSRSEILQIIAIAGTAVTALIGAGAVWMARSIGARAEGGMQERVRLDARNRAQEIRSGEKEKEDGTSN